MFEKRRISKRGKSEKTKMREEIIKKLMKKEIREEDIQRRQSGKKT